MCSETAQHPQLVERAAAAGKAILCEKPIATGLADADRIIAAVDKAGVLFMQSFPKRLDPVSHELRRLVQAEELGRLHLVRIRHGHFYGLDEDFKHRWYTRPELSGGGALLDEGVHATDLLCWLFGLPDSVVATTSSALLGLAVEDSATALYSYAGGMTAEVTASFAFAAADTSIELYGTQGTVLVSGVDLASRDITPGGFLRRYDSAQSERRWQEAALIPQFKRGQFHQQNAIAFSRCLRDGSPPPADARDGRNALLLVERAYRAARSGRRQPVAGAGHD